MQIDVLDAYGRSIGLFNTEGFLRLPAIINWQGQTFHRYGRVGDYRYEQEPVTVVPAHTITLF